MNGNQSNRWVVRLCMAACLALSGCQSSPTTKPSATAPPGGEAAPQNELQADKPADRKAPGAPTYPPIETSRFDAPGKIVAIGDLHGDLSATIDVLQLAGAIDDAQRWIGKNLTIVQTGDQLDRGDDERAILDLLTKLRTEAEAAGGSLVVLNGNHETMNAAGDFRYVTQGAIGTFQGVLESEVSPALMARVSEPFRDRAAAFFPGGQYARLLAERPIVAIVDKTLFAHGGVHLSHIEYGIDRMNREVSAWLRGTGSEPAFLKSERSPVWSRDYSVPSPSKKACAELGKVLLAAGASRLVVGHTVQQSGITSACDDRVWRIDVGMSAHYGGEKVMALEIDGDRVQPLSRPKSTRALAPAAE